MTNKQAIYFLKQLLDYQSIVIATEYQEYRIEALKIAIQKLEQEKNISKS